jgi:hypothetical protein
MMRKSGCMPIESTQFINISKQFEAAVKNFVQSTADLQGTRQDAAHGRRASNHPAHLSNLSKPPAGLDNT